MSAKVQDYVIPNPPPQGIVCAPVSDVTPNGYAGVKNQFLKTGYVSPAGIIDGRYQKDETNNYVISAAPDEVGDINVLEQKYVKTGLPSEDSQDFEGVFGGNCYWVRPADNLVLSWKGPHGFQVPPKHLLTPEGGAAPTSTEGYQVFLSATVTLGLPADVYVQQRFVNELYCHGKVYTTPGKVFGAGMLGSYIVIVCENTRLTDSVYSGKLEKGGVINWSLVGNIVLTDSPELIHLGRQSVYSFSGDGLSLIAMIDALDPSNTTNTFWKRVIVRVALSLDVVGDIQLSTPTTERVEMSLLVTSTETATAGSTSFSGDFVHSDPVLDELYGVGFGGPGGTVEVTLTPELVNLTSAGSASGNISVDGLVGNSVWSFSQNTTISFLLNFGVISLVMAQYTNVSSFTSTIDGNLDPGQTQFYNRTDDTQQNITTPSIVYFDAMPQVVVFSREEFSKTASMSADATEFTLLHSVETYTISNTLDYWSKDLGLFDAVQLYLESDTINFDTTEDPPLLRLGIYGNIVEVVRFPWVFQQQTGAINIILCGDAQTNYTGQVKASFFLPIAPLSFSIFIPLIQGPNDMLALFMVAGADNSLTGTLDMSDAAIFRI